MRRQLLLDNYLTNIFFALCPFTFFPFYALILLFL